MTGLGQTASDLTGRTGRLPDRFDPFTPEVREDPYPMYRRLRDEEPVFEAIPGMWVLTRYDDCLMVLRDSRRFGSDVSTSEMYRAVRPGPRGARGLGGQVGAGGSLFTLDPPDHTRLRGLVQQAFTARVVEQVRPRIKEHVDRLLDGFEGTASVDLVHRFAYPLPIAVICELLGVPVDDWSKVQRWSDDLVPTLDGFITPQVAVRAHRATQEFRRYLLDAVKLREAGPGDDLISALITAEVAGSKLTRGELIALCMILVVAGHETTVNLISNGVLALLHHPDQLDLLMNDPKPPELLRSAIEEILRYDSPAQLVARTVQEDVEIRGVRIRAGHIVIPVIGAANRDSAQFPDPDRFDITRADNRHLSFAAGAHFCLGASLARAEGQFAIGSMFQRFPRIRLVTGPIERRDTVALRGPKALPVVLR
jgi:pimeloyl-[acyl-carrier protein] synthase